MWTAVILPFYRYVSNYKCPKRAFERDAYIGPFTKFMSNTLVLDKNAEPEKLWRVVINQDSSIKVNEVNQEELSKEVPSSEVTVAILPCKETISGVLTLPFVDKSRMTKLLQPEFEDHVPFDSDGYTLAVRPTSLMRDTEHLIAYSAAPKTVIGETLNTLKAIGRDPSCIIPCAPLLSVLVKREAKLATGHSIAILKYQKWLLIGVFSDGRYISGRNYYSESEY